MLMLFLTIFIKYRRITSITQFPTDLPVYFTQTRQLIDEYFFIKYNIQLGQSDTTPVTLNFKTTFTYITNLFSW